MFEFIYIIIVIFSWLAYMGIMFYYDMLEEKKHLDYESFYEMLL